MKRKLISMLSLLLALTMIFPMGIFVSASSVGGDTAILMDEGGGGDDEDPGTETEPVTPPTPTVEYKILSGGVDYTGKTIPEVFFGNGKPGTVQLTATSNNSEDKFKWVSYNSDIATVDDNGLVTPQKSGTARIVLLRDLENVAWCEIEFVEVVCSGISVISKPTKMNYVSGDTLNTAGMVIEASYNDKTKKTVTTGWTTEPSGVLSAKDTSFKVLYEGQTCVVEGLTVAERAVQSIQIVNVVTKFTEGDRIPEFDVRVTYNYDNNKSITISSGYDVYINGAKVPAGYTFKTTDTKLKIMFEGQSTSEYNITVSKKTETPPPADESYTVTMATSPNTKVYKVGDTFSSTGMKVSIKDSSGKTVPASTVSSITFTAYKFEASDVGKTEITLNVTLKIGGKTYTTTLLVTGLTINSASSKITVYSITEVELEKSKYPVGHKFQLSDIKYVKYKSERNGATERITGLMLENYTNDIYLEVLDEDGRQKRSKANVIEEDDIQTRSNGRKYIELLFVIDDKEYEFDTDVGDSGVYYYLDSERNLIAVYEDIDDALRYTEDQDRNIDTDDFDLDNLREKNTIILKLGEDQKVPSSLTLKLCHNVEIDLNGHTLTIYTDTIDITKSNKNYTLTVTNSSSDDGTLVYYDKSMTMTVKRNDELVFEYDEDVPGVYTVKVNCGANGSVTTTPKLDYKEVKVGHGSDLKFTITPDKGYILDKIKVGRTEVSEKNYTKSYSGVISYTLSDIDQSCEVDITFIKEDKAPAAWQNPFNDVSSSSSYYSAVRFVYTNNLFKGTTATMFAPSTSMTRAMFVTVLSRLAGADVTRYNANAYSDCKNISTEYSRAIGWANAMGLVEGYGDGTFGPDNPITRQQMYVLMYRYTTFVENKRVSTSLYIDASDASDVADWAETAVKAATSNGYLVKTIGSRIEPKGNAARSDLAQLLEKYCVSVLGWESDAE